MNLFRTVRMMYFGRPLSKTRFVTYQVMRWRYERERALLTCNLIGKVYIDPRRSLALPDFSREFFLFICETFPRHVSGQGGSINFPKRSASNSYALFAKIVPETFASAELLS